MDGAGCVADFGYADNTAPMVRGTFALTANSALDIEKLKSHICTICTQGITAQYGDSTPLLDIGFLDMTTKKLTP